MSDPKHDSSGLTKEFIKEEFLKCAENCQYFLENYAYIRTEEHGIQKFELFDYQKEIVKELQENRYLAILKSRQLGVSTIIAGFIAWYILFRKARHVFIMATKREKAGISFEMVKTFVLECPQWLRLYSVVKNNSMRFELSNGSWVKCQATSMDAGVGEAASLFFIDEAALIEKLREHWVGLFPTISTGGRCVMASTPRGVGNKFWEIVIGAQNGENEFKVKEYPWSRRFSKEWFERERIGKTAREIAQEYECVSPNTKILTRDGFKLAKDLSINDEVITHTGRFKKVKKTFKRRLCKDEKVYSLSIPLVRQNEIKITSSHPIFQYQYFKRKINGEQKQNGFNLIKSDDCVLDFISIDQRKTKNYLNVLNVPIVKTELTNEIQKIDLYETFKDIAFWYDENFIRYRGSHLKTKRFIEIDYDLGKLIGYYLSEGFKDDAKCFVNFGFHEDEVEIHDDIERIADKLGFLFRKEDRSYSNCTVVSISNRFFQRIINLFVEKKYCYEKLLRNTIWKTNINFVRGILEGIWLGDGLHKPEYKNILGLKNEKLIYQIRNLMSIFKLFPRVGIKKKKNGEPYLWYLELNNIQMMKIGETLNFDQTKLEVKGSKNRAGSRTRFLNNHLVGRIQYKIDKSYDDYVYNFEIEDDNTYICDNLVVHNCKFLESGDTFLDINVFEKMKQTVSEPIQKIGDLWIWKNAEFGHKYLIGADVARGDGKDFSAASVLDINTGEVVAEYRGKIKTNDFSEFLVSTGRNYNNALIIPESNSFGDAVIQRILELEYEDLYFSTKATGGHSFGVLTYWESIGNRSAKAGLHTTSVSRPAMLQKLEELLRLGIITIHSKRCYDEFTTFIWKGQRPEATRGSTDDIIMSLAICAVIKDRHFKDNAKIEQKIDTLASGFLSSREPFDIGKKSNNEMEQLALLIAKL